MLVLLMGGIFNYAVEMGSGVMICIRSLIKIDSGIQKLIGGGIQSQRGDLTSLHLFFQNKESRLKTDLNYTTMEM
jgi:hypothetical protein